MYQVADIGKKNKIENAWKKKTSSKYTKISNISNGKGVFRHTHINTPPNNSLCASAKANTVRFISNISIHYIKLVMCSIAFVSLCLIAKTHLFIKHAQFLTRSLGAKKSILFCVRFFFFRCLLYVYTILFFKILFRSNNNNSSNSQHPTFVGKFYGFAFGFSINLNTFRVLARNATYNVIVCRRNKHCTGAKAVSPKYNIIMVFIKR